MANGIIQDQNNQFDITPQNSEDYLATYRKAVGPSEQVAWKSISEPIGGNFQTIANNQSRQVSDKIINDWMAGFGVVSKERQSPVEPLVTPAITPAPAAVSTVAPGIVNAPVPPGETYTERMAKRWEESGAIPLRQPGGYITFQQPGQGNVEYEALQTRRDLGLEPQVGMAAYEQSAAKMREDARIESLTKGLPAKERAGVIAEALGIAGKTEATRIGAVAEQQKTGAATQLKIYEAAAKSKADWAKLGIESQDVKSKIAYRKAQEDEMLTRTGLLEPLKIQLAQSKNATENNKIYRDFLMKALDIDFEAKRKRFENSLMPGIPPTPEQKAEWNNLTQGYQNAVQNINNARPQEGSRKQFISPDGSIQIGQFTNGQWVDVTNQVNKQGVVGR